MFFILAAAFLVVVTFVFGLTVFLQSREMRRLEADLEAANTVSIKYINYYNSEFEARTTAQHERDEALVAQRSLLHRLTMLDQGSVNRKSKQVVRGKRVVAPVKKKKRA